MPTTHDPVSDLTLEIQHTIEIDAAPDVVFESLLAQLGPDNATPDGTHMPMTLEAWPGGRWLRDLGNEDGHLWGHVQVIKRPTLLEITGPLFMSYAAVSHVQYRIEAEGTGSRLSLTHRAIGPIDAAHREGLQHGWMHLLEVTRRRAEAIAPR